ncbi:MAG: hypothetical protein ACK4JB_05745 [Reyranella sp.]
MGSGRALITLWLVGSAMSWIGWMLFIRMSCVREVDGRLLCQTERTWLAFLSRSTRDPLEVALMGLIPALLILIVGIALFQAMRPS